MEKEPSEFLGDDESADEESLHVAERVVEFSRRYGLSLSAFFNGEHFDFFKWVEAVAQQLKDDVIADLLWQHPDVSELGDVLRTELQRRTDALCQRQ